MDTLQRSLIEKIALENGWEIAELIDNNRLKLSSARHDGVIEIAVGSDKSCTIIFTAQDVSEELSASFPHFRIESLQFIATSSSKLANLLKRAAQLFYSLPDRLAERFVKDHETEEYGPNETEALRIRLERLKQNQFREALLNYWQGACAITSINHPSVLRASHIKPWADCKNDKERLNVYNGLLLSANFDALFDSGLITFDNDGIIICSPTLTPDQKISLELRPNSRLKKIQPQHIPFLEWHKTRVFKNL
jgi:predicted restriction endonuclease